MAASRQVLDLTLILLIYGVGRVSAIRMRGLESPVESGSDVLVMCEGSSADAEFLSSFSIYGKLAGETERRLINVVGTLAGVKKNWGNDVQASFRERASFTANMTHERAFIGLRIRNLTCSDSGMMFRCKLFGVGVSATSVPTQLRVRAKFSRLYIDGGEFECDALTSQSQHMRIGCNGCDCAAIRGKVTSFSCWGDVDANLRDNFSISWYRTTWDNSSQQWTNVPLEGVRSDLGTNDTMQAHGQNDSDCQFYTLKSTLEYRLQLDEQDMEVTCEITGPAERGMGILANRTIKTCSVDLEDAPMNVVVTPPSIIADIGNSTVFLCKAHEDPPVTYEWFKMVGSTKISIGGQRSDPALLHIDGVTKEKTGTYMCLAKDLDRSKEVSVQLQYPDQPEMILPEEVVVLPGLPIDLVCDVRASGRVDRLVWPVKIKDGARSIYQTLSRADDVLLRGHNATATLHIRTGSTNIHASGNYSCQTTVHGIVYVRTTYIRVEGGADIQSYSPSSAILMTLGSSPSLTCNPTGSPEPVVTWLFQNSSLKSGPNTVITTSRVMQGKVVSKLQIVKLTLAMIGNYTCRAENQHGVATVHFTILRKGPPAAPILSVRSNQDGEFHLNVKANPDEGGDPVSNYIVTYQLFPQGRTHIRTFTGKVDAPITTTVAPEAMIRLVNGGHRYRGRVEIYYNGAWGTVCDNGFGGSAARVVCRQLGLSTSNVKVYSNAYFGRGTGPIHLRSVQCRGTEAKLTYCVSRMTSMWGRQRCYHSDDVGVTCNPRDLYSYGRTNKIDHVAKIEREIITFDKIINGHAHYVAVRGSNKHGAGEPAELLLDI